MSTNPQEAGAKADLSRDARSLAYTQAIYASMGDAKITFHRPEKIHPRTKAALDELIADGWFREDWGPQGAVTYSAVEPRIFKALDFGEPDRADSFPLRLPDDDDQKEKGEAPPRRRPRA